jgi:hypothetical protein
MPYTDNEVWLYVLAKLLHNVVLGHLDHNLLNFFSCVVNNDDKLLPPLT